MSRDEQRVAMSREESRWAEMSGDERRWEEMGGDGWRWDEMGGDEPRLAWAVGSALRLVRTAVGEGVAHHISPYLPMVGEGVAHGGADDAQRVAESRC